MDKPKPLRVTASALHLREHPRPDALSLGTLPRGETVSPIVRVDDWVPVRTADGRVGYVHGSYVEEVESAATPAPPVGYPPVPNGMKELRALYGEPATPECQAGRVTLPEPLPLSWSPKESVRTFACHRLVAARMQGAFNEIHAAGLWPLLHNWGGCYAVRNKRGLGTPSTHSWGIAVDVDVHRNGLGMKPQIDPRIVAIFQRHGFKWGGEFKRLDAMHFQAATGV